MSEKGEKLPEQPGKRRWGVEQRLEFIEFRLFWDGSLNRSDIINRFGVSMPQASGDLALYKELAPANITYDSSEKRFVATPNFVPRIIEPNPDRYLIQMRAIADQVIAVEDTQIGFMPIIDSMPILHRKVSPTILRQLLVAVRNRTGLSVHYHSMNSLRPQAMWREITPHAFAYDGLRWHVRAYCHLEARFKDFILSRFLDVGGATPAAAAPEQDEQWNSFFGVVLVPNPAFSESQRKTIALDYEMLDGRLVVRVRRALLYYFNKRLRLDIASKVDNPKETPIVVENKKEFESALKGAGALTVSANSGP